MNRLKRYKRCVVEKSSGDGVSLGTGASATVPASPLGGTRCTFDCCRAGLAGSFPLTEGGVPRRGSSEQNRDVERDKPVCYGTRRGKISRSQELQLLDELVIQLLRPDVVDCLDRQLRDYIRFLAVYRRERISNRHSSMPAMPVCDPEYYSV